MKLIREVKAFIAGSKLGTPERLVLLLLAERANDESREAWSSPEWDLGDLAGMSEKTLRECLARLAGRGVNVRVPLGTKADGSPLYACRGRQVTFRIPLLPASGSPNAGGKPPAKAEEKSGVAAGLDSNAGGFPPAKEPNDGENPPATDQNASGKPPPSDSNAGGFPPNAGGFRSNAGGKPPSFSSTPSTPSSQRAPAYDVGALLEPVRTIARTLLADDPTVTADEARAIHRLIIDKHHPDNVMPYIKRIADSGGLPGYLEEIRGLAERAANAAAQERLAKAQRELNAMRDAGPWCKHGEAANARTAGGEPFCVLCRRDLPAQPVPDQTTDPRVARIVSQYRAALSYEPTTAELVAVTAQATRMVATSGAAA